MSVLFLDVNDVKRCKYTTKNISTKDLCDYFLKPVGFSTSGNVGIANKRMRVTSPPASFHLLYIGRVRTSLPPAPADHRQHVIPAGFSWTCDAGHQFALLIRPQVIEPLTTTLKMNQDKAVVITTWLLPIHSIYQAWVGPKMQSRPFHEVMPTPLMIACPLISTYSRGTEVPNAPEEGRSVNKSRAIALHVSTNSVWLLQHCQQIQFIMRESIRGKGSSVI